MIVTTGRRPSAMALGRALALASRLETRYLPRIASISRLLLEANAKLAYVVQNHRDELRGRGGGLLYVHPGMIHYKRADGRRHPLVRAVAPPEASEVTSIFDATVGMASDAIHIATVLPHVHLSGCEASGPLFALLQEGLPRLACGLGRWADGAGRIHVVQGEATPLLEAMQPGQVDVVYLDPLFDTPRTAQPGFEILRAVALGGSLTERLVHAAERAARRRVVLKVPGASEVPRIAPSRLGWNGRIRGRAVDYLVGELELERPMYEAPDLGAVDGGGLLKRQDER